LFSSKSVLTQDYVEIPTYNSCNNPPDIEPIPSFFKDLHNLTKKELKEYKKMLNIKDKSLDLVESHLLITASSGSEKMDSIESARKMAWYNAKMKFIEQYLGKDDVQITGIPLVVIRQEFVQDTCKNNRGGVTCYMLVYIAAVRSNHIGYILFQRQG
jgi:succinate dehydrogenase flavin-adding protein (antitoxin of CptAB toxin-antitoxin module)